MKASQGPIMRHIPFRQIGRTDISAVQRAEDAFGSAFTLADVLAVGRAQSPPANVSDIVTQDEFTHDVVMPFGQHFLSVDVT
jgi:hypothetical protein